MCWPFEPAVDRASHVFRRKFTAVALRYASKVRNMDFDQRRDGAIALAADAVAAGAELLIHFQARHLRHFALRWRCAGASRHQ
jgi:hypothetical protein